MHFAVQKDLLAKALRDVNSAVATRVVQPVLSNVLIETLDDATVRFVGTDLDLTIKALCPAVVYTYGSITLPGKKLLEIVSKLPNELVSFQIGKEGQDVSINCSKAKFSLLGLSADNFPKIITSPAAEGFLMPADVLRLAVMQTSFAAANYDLSSVLGGVYLAVSDGVFELTATDGSRIANRREELLMSSHAGNRNEEEKEETAALAKARIATLEKTLEVQAIIPARACSELLKMLDTRISSHTVRVSLVDGQIVFENDTHFLGTRLIGGSYPAYRSLFPAEFTYLARFDRADAQAAIERVAVMADESTNLVKFHFEGDVLQIAANSPDIGRAQEEIPMHFEGQVLDVAVNVRYVLDVLQKLTAVNILLEMAGSLKPLVFKAEGDDTYRYLLMPVQLK